MNEVVCGGISGAINGVATVNGNGAGKHTATADYLLGADTMHLSFEVEGNTGNNFWNNVAFNGDSHFDWTARNTTTTPGKETYNLAMPTNNTVNGILKWGPNVSTNLNTNFNQSPSNTVINLTFSSGVTAIMHLSLIHISEPTRPY